MTWDAAYCEMKEGAAIRRPHWIGIQYLFWQDGKVWAFYTSGRVGCYLHYFQRAAGNEDDWLVIADYDRPITPAPKSGVRPPTRQYFGERLAKRQAEMKARIGSQSHLQGD